MVKIILRECLDSAISQTYPSIEIIIVDDNSKDNTIPIIQEYLQKNSRIKLFINEKNLGLVGNWNRCMEHAKGEWIKFLFQDDLLHIECVGRMLKESNDSIKFIVCNRQFIFDDTIAEQVKYDWMHKKNNLQRLFGINHPEFINAERMSGIASAFVSSNIIGEPTAVMFHKDIIEKLGNFNPLFLQICDLEYWLRIATNFGLFYLPETLATFRMHSQGTSAINRQAQMDSVDKIILANDLLQSERYANFRSNISKWRFQKISEMFKTRIYEVNLALKKNPNNLRLLNHFNDIKIQIPLISQYESPSLKTKFIYFIVKMRRVFFRFFK